MPCSCSGRPGKDSDGSFTIQEPPTPCVGIVRRPAVIAAESFNWTPATENLRGAGDLRRPLPFVDVGAVEAEDDLVATDSGEGADRLAVKTDIEDAEVSPSTCLLHC